MTTCRDCKPHEHTAMCLEVSNPSGCKGRSGGEVELCPRHARVEELESENVRLRGAHNETIDECMSLRRDRDRLLEAAKEVSENAVRFRSGNGTVQISWEVFEGLRAAIGGRI